MTAPHADVLVFVEDPGAANFVADLPVMLAKRGWSIFLATAGTATDYLAQRGVIAEVLSPGMDLDSLVAQVAPRLIVVGTAEDRETAGLKFIAIAAKRGIPSVGVLDASTHIEHRFRGPGTDPLAFCPDKVIVPDDRGREAFATLGLADQRVVVAGHPHWDHVRAMRGTFAAQDRAAVRSRLFPGLTPARTVLLFAAEISTGLDPEKFKPERYTIRGTGSSNGRTEIVIEEFLHAVQPRRAHLHLVLRLHPKQGSNELSFYHDNFDAISKNGPPLEMFYAADAIVGMTSMALLEAALLQRPTLSIVPCRDEAAWLPSVATGITRCAWTRGDVAKEIGLLLDDPRHPSQDALDRFFPTDAMKRVLATLESFLRPDTALVPTIADP